MTPDKPKTPIREMTYAILPDRMPPIPEAELTDAQRGAVADISSGLRGEIRGPYWPILRSPGFLMCVQRVGEYTRYHCPLDRRINEMATMMDTLKQRMLIITPDFEKHEKYPALKEAYDNYKALEAMLSCTDDNK